MALRHCRSLPYFGANLCMYVYVCMYVLGMKREVNALVSKTGRRRPRDRRGRERERVVRYLSKPALLALSFSRLPPFRSLHTTPQLFVLKCCQSGHSRTTPKKTKTKRSRSE